MSHQQAPKPSALLDTRVVYCGDNLEQISKLPDTCVDLIYIDPPFNSNRNYDAGQSGSDFWGETMAKRAFEGRHENTRHRHNKETRAALEVSILSTIQNTLTWKDNRQMIIKL